VRRPEAAAVAASIAAAPPWARARAAACTCAPGQWTAG